ncbi:MAG: FeoC-like transcriptional regulator [Sphaerochaeta sp.]|jgi:hypothetical protein|nr:hypothetical protein [Spirochaetales bacterium]
MLKEVLARIQSDGFLSKALLARELSVTEPMIEDAIGQLIRMGYMQEEESGADCITSCTGCAFATMCHKKLVTMYQLTQRGKKLLA